MIVLYIVLFIVFLSTLIMVHELGHLLTAKIFNVYCFEYAIGFGPKLFSRKKKNGETYFSIRAIPFGGFVSMYGENDVLPEGFEGTIDPSRSLNSIKKWKKIIIMAAGVIMNFLLAITMFFVYEVGFPTYTSRYAHTSVIDNSIAYNAGLRSGDYVYAIASSTSESSYVFYDNEAVLTYSDNTQETVYFGFEFSSMTIKDTSLYGHSVVFREASYGQLTIDDFNEYTVNQIIENEITNDDSLNIKTVGFIESLTYNPNTKKVYYLISENFAEANANIDKGLYVYAEYETDEQRNMLTNIPRGETITFIGNMSSVTNTSDNTSYKAIKIKDMNIRYSRPFYKDGNLLLKEKSELELKDISFKTYLVDENNYQGKGSSTIAFDNIALTLSGDKYYLDRNIGIKMQLDTRMNNFGEAVKYTFEDFGNGASLIFRTLGELFTTADTWKNIGGILAVGVTTSQVLRDYGFGQFLFYWALISVNLGIINLLPFPGLDGWHILVTIIEGITRKEIPPKVKSWVSAVGIIILFALMILILVKDIIGLF